MTDRPKMHAPKGRIKAANPTDSPDHMDAPRCTATAKGSGERCKRRPIRGGMVCVKHGGGAPQVKAKAEERLAALVHPAITRLNELLNQQEFPTVAIAAVRDILDRSMGKPGESLKVSGTLSLEQLVAGSRKKPDDDEDDDK